MEKFREKLIKRRNTMMIIALIALVVVLVKIFYFDNRDNLPLWLNYQLEFLTGIFAGLELLFVIYVIKIRKALNDENVLQQLYIEENDERKKFIRAKAGQPLLMILSGVLVIAAVIVAAFNLTISMALVIVVLFQMTIGVIYKLYLLKTI